jgi:hypothetical protein
VYAAHVARVVADDRAARGADAAAAGVARSSFHNDTNANGNVNGSGGGVGFIASVRAYLDVLYRPNNGGGGGGYDAHNTGGGGGGGGGSQWPDAFDDVVGGYPLWAQLFFCLRCGRIGDAVALAR